MGPREKKGGGGGGGADPTGPHDHDPLRAGGGGLQCVPNMITQHIASTGDPGHSKGWQFVRYLVSNPLWLFGWVALAGSFVFQAPALHNGQMSVVQPLLVTELVFAVRAAPPVDPPADQEPHVVGCGHHLRRPGPVRRRGRAHGRECRSRPARPGSAPPSPPAGRRPSWPWSACPRLTGAAGGGAGGGHGHPVGAGGHVHQGHDRHAERVRGLRDVRPLARLRADSS